MLKKDLQQVSKKLISMVMIIIIIYTIINPLIYNKVYAETSDSDPNNIYNIDESLYPGYATLLQNLKSSHPNWTFTLLYTNLEWADVLRGETAHGRSLVQGKTGEWLCYECGGKGYDGSSWVCASQVATAHYLDPRNFLTEDKIFQFESLSYIPTIHTEAGVEAILNGTFMSHTRICDSYGNPSYGEKTFAQAIMYAAQVSNVSPYHIASRIRQEVVISGGKPSPSVSGIVSGYEGLFNFCNIGATPTVSTENPNGDSVINGLIYARNSGWTNPETAIVEAARWIGRNYISIGQNSLYLQKWDIIGDSLYSHQYMTNIQAVSSESTTIRNSYKGIFGDLSNTSFNFIIPMYKHIPINLSRYPSSSTYVSQNVQIYDNTLLGVNIRETPNGNVIKTCYNGYQLLRIELEAEKTGSTTWDKVMLEDGTIGYVSTKFLREVPRAELSKEAYINTDAQLYNGPRSTQYGTTTFRQLYKGQPVTVLEEGRFWFDNCMWSKIKLGDSTVGYVTTSVVTEGTFGEKVTVTCNTELAIRTTPNGGLIGYINPGVVVQRIEKATEKVGGYYWDKVITPSGSVGYMARERYNPYSLWLTPEGTVPITGEKVEINETEKIIKVIPQATIEDVRDKASGETVTLISGTENLGTGAIIEKNGVQYTVIKLGDISKDGIVDARDASRILNYAVGSFEIPNNLLSAVDINKDGIVDARDASRILNYAVGSYSISL